MEILISLGYIRAQLVHAYGDQLPQALVHKAQACVLLTLYGRENTEEKNMAFMALVEDVVKRINHVERILSIPLVGKRITRYLFLRRFSPKNLTMSELVKHQLLEFVTQYYVSAESDAAFPILKMQSYFELGLHYRDSARVFNPTYEFLVGAAIRAFIHDHLASWRQNVKWM